MNRSDRSEQNTYRQCPDCGCEEFHLWRRTDLEADYTVLACVDCGNTVGGAQLTDPRMKCECPECGSEDTGPWIADFDWVCRDCRTYFDNRTQEVMGRAE